MKFLTVFKLNPEDMSDCGPSPEDMAAMGALIAEMRTAGVMVDTGGVMPTSVQMRVRRAGDTISVTDGPFTETKEIVGGFAVLNVASKDEAVAWTKRFLDLAGNGVSELIEVTEP